MSANESRHRLASWKSRVLVTLFALVMGLVVAELSLRALGIPRFHSVKSTTSTDAGFKFYTHSSHEDVLMYTLSPLTTIEEEYPDNPRGYFGENNTVQFRINALGFRGPEFTTATTDEQFKIAFLGDSFTFGEGVQFEDIYSERTAAILNEHRGDGTAVVVSENYGMKGFNTSQELVLLHHRLLPARPDLVVVGFFLNDVSPPTFTYDAEKESITYDQTNPFWFGFDERPPDSGLLASHLGKLIWQVKHHRSMTRKNLDYYAALYSEKNPHLGPNLECLRQIVATCESRKIPVIVLCFPLLHDLGDTYPLRHIHDRVRKTVEEAGDPENFLDLLAVYEGKRAEDLWVHPADHHPNEIAHDIAARALCERIKAAGLLPE